MLKNFRNQDESGNREEAAPESDAQPSFERSSAFDSTPAQQSDTNEQGMNSTKNILSNDVEITGNLKFSHDLTIDGKIKGNVTSNGNLILGENALIQGEIKTKSVTIYGSVEGNLIVSEGVALKAEASVKGDIQAGTMSIEAGASFVGRSTVGSKSNELQDKAARAASRTSQSSANGKPNESAKPSGEQILAVAS